MASNSMTLRADQRKPADTSNQSLSDAMWAIVQSSKNNEATDRRLAELARTAMKSS